MTSHTLASEKKLAVSLKRSTIHYLEPNPNRMLAIPELLRLISSFLSKRDAFHFAQCSRVCFQAAVEYIWHKIESIQPLLNLLLDSPEDTLGQTSTVSRF